MRLTEKGYLLVAPLTLFLAVVFLAPMVILLVTSFYEDQALVGGLQGLTLANYIRFLSDYYYRGILFDTIRLSLYVAALCNVVGYPIAYYLDSRQGAERTYLTLLVLSPLLVSLVIRNFGWVIVLGPSGLVNSALLAIGVIGQPIPLLFTETAVIIGLVHVWLPFAILAIVTALHNIDPNLRRAAQNLGASPLRTFLSVTLPLSVPGVLAGTLLVFALSVSSFVTPALLGGSRLKMLGQVAFEQTLIVFDWPFAATASFILLGLVTAITVLGTRALSGARFGANAQ